MAQYQIPQFIDIEDKVIGFLTIKQFFYLLALPATLYGLHFVLTPGYLILLTVVFLPISLAFAFGKVNGRPFKIIFGQFVKFSMSGTLYIWKRERSVSRIKLSKVKKKSNKTQIQLKPAQAPEKQVAELASFFDNYLDRSAHPQSNSDRSGIIDFGKQIPKKHAK